jgi:hemerythrin-like metal-binding domain
MSIVCWTEDMAVGVPEIDAQHKQLLALVRDVHEAVVGGHGHEKAEKALESLCNYTVEHFATEEKYMDVQTYADYDRHMLEHMNCSTKALDFLQAYDEVSDLDMKAFLDYVANWVCEHILGVDKGLGEHVLQRGGGPVASA